MEMFKVGLNYLILGEKNSNKTFLGNNILEQLTSSDQSASFDLFNKEKEFNEHDGYQVDNRNNNQIAYFLDNYSTKDNRNDKIKRLVKDKNVSVVIVSPYALGLDQVNRIYMDYIFIAKINDENTLRTIYNVYLKHTIKYDQFKELNNNCDIHHFVTINKNSKGFGYYHPTRGFAENLKNTFYEKVVNLLWN